MTHRYIKLLCVSSLIVAFLLGSCKKLVEVNSPITSTNATNVFQNDANAAAVLTGIYTDLSNGILVAGPTGTSILLGLSSDELVLDGSVSDISPIAYYTNTLSTNSGGFEFWQTIYPYVYKCNAAIEGLNNSTGLTPSVKKQLLGEAKFMRAFFYFYLVNLYGDIPLPLTTDYKTNTLLPRVEKSKVYDQIISDLKEAENSLSPSYLNGSLQAYTSSPQKLRPTSWAAAFLLAKANLYAGKFTDCETEASKVINNVSMFSLSTIRQVFLKNSSESIWQLQPVASGWNTLDARYFIIPPTGTNNFQNSYYLNNTLLQSFEVGDRRKTNWINNVTISGSTYYYPFKYRSATQDDPVTEYLMIFRLGELYLIRAEARAQMSNVSGSQSDLNIVRQRAGLPNTSSADKSALLTAILHERQVELFSELGNRWFDIKRFGQIDAIMSTVTPQKSTNSWKTTQQLFPIPYSDIQKDPNIIQNPGY